jgi:hypothetical protein
VLVAALLTGIGGLWATPVHALALPRPADAHAASRPASDLDLRASEQYVFSMGVVDRVGAETLTIRFADGDTETYRLDGATTFQTQNGDALGVSDLAVGEMVIVLTVEDDSLAVTVVSGGDEGFHAVGPADIRGHDERECAECDAHSP